MAYATNKHGEPDTKMDLLLAMACGEINKVEFVGMTKSITARVPVHLFAKLEALSRVCEIARADVVVQALDAAFEQMESRMSGETFNDYRKDVVEVFNETIPLPFKEVV